ncbi:hypothetical protein TWF281_008295 [Arthrobotrys megalospora]
MPCCGYCCQNPSIEGRRRSRRRNPEGDNRQLDHPCHVCGNVFYSALEVEEHFKVVHGYPCSFCQKKCRSSGGLKLHQKIHRFSAALSELEEELEARSDEGDEDEDTGYLSGMSQSSPRTAQLHHLQTDETYDETGPNTHNLFALRSCHRCSRSFAKTSAYLHHLENSRCGTSRDRIYEIVRKLDEDNLITPPHPFRYIPWLSCEF